jgi:hypothetical protein
MWQKKKTHINHSLFDLRHEILFRKVSAAAGHLPEYDAQCVTAAAHERVPVNRKKKSKAE